MAEKNLQQYGEYFKTDKHDSFHKFAGKTYLDIYEPLLKEFVRRTNRKPNE